MENDVLSDRYTETDIYERVVAEATHEMTKSYRRLVFSGIAGGFSITLTFLLYASVYDATEGAAVISAVLYPLGFIYIIMGNYQLFTENTLPPVTLVLERISSIPAVLGIWTLVIAGNFIGGILGASLLAYTGIFPPSVAQTASEIAIKGLQEQWWDLFFKSTVAGLIVAGVVWLDFSVDDAMGRVAMIYMAFLAIPVGNLYHVVVSTTEFTYLFLVRDVSLLLGIHSFLLPVLLGNTLGGVVLVTVVNYYQTAEGLQPVTEKLSLKEMILTYNRTEIPEDDVVQEE